MAFTSSMGHAGRPGRLALFTFWITLVVLTGLHLTTLDSDHERNVELIGTKKANVELAYNLYRHGAFSRTDDVGDHQPEPSAYRPPGYPAFLALGMQLSTDLDGHDLSDVKREFNRLLSPLYGLQELLLVATAFVAMSIVWRRTRNLWLTLVPFPLLCQVPMPWLTYRSVLNTYTNIFYPTSLMTFLMIMLVLGLLFVAEHRSYGAFIGAGLLLGITALTRAAFVYFIPVVVVAFLAWAWSQAAVRRRVLLGTLCFVVASTGPTLGWMLRNRTHFDRMFIAERGGYQLNVRAKMLDMSPVVYFSSFLYWSNSPLLRETILPGLVTPRKLMIVARELDDDHPRSFKKKAKARWLNLERRYGSTEADRMLVKESLAEIIRRPVKHALVSIPLVHRGLCIERPYWLNLIGFGCLLGALVRALRRRDGGMLALLSPAVFCFVFYVSASNNLPRYNTPMIPILWVAAIDLFHGLWRDRRTVANVDPAS